MAAMIEADANPEKRLFISLLTRDIPLAAAFLDLVDNSINAAVEPFAGRLSTAADYLTVFADDEITPSTRISLTVAAESVSIEDTAVGISSETARKHVFRFGRAEGEEHALDRLSVYGIGLKRAIFKLGNRVSIRSDHVDGGFDLELNVRDWQADPRLTWTLDITERQPVAPDQTGTRIIVNELYVDVQRRINDGVFLGQLKESLARTYAYYLMKFVRIALNNEFIDAISPRIGSNHSSKSFDVDGVSCHVTAGIGIPQGGAFRDRTSGWFVFCNGRAVISADKTPLTGWGGAGLPIFQPKHRPFLGTAFFVSPDAEKLPWTTTKSGINEDSAVWQIAKRHMVDIGKQVISFLDGRYTDEGTELASKELQEVAKAEAPVSVLTVAAGGEARSFEAPRPVEEKTTTRIQYDARVPEVKKISQYLGKPGMSGSDVGRYTFNYFLRNEVEAE